jgi:hypothetical protein
MQFNQIILARHDTGQILPYGKATVYFAGTLTAATLFDVNGGGISNPATAGPTGMVGMAAIDNLYDVVVTSADGVYNSPTIQKLQFFDLLNARLSRLVYSTYALLALATSYAAGTAAEVMLTDTGTHTDPVIGGTVSNNGVFRWSTSPAGWQRMGDLAIGAQGPPGPVTVATSASGTAASTKAGIAGIATPTNGQASILTGLGGGSHTFNSANLSAYVTNDPLKGVYIAPASDTTGASGAWVRDGDILTPPMFGGVTNYKQGNRATGTPVYGESSTLGSTNGVLVDSRAACQSMLDLIKYHQERIFTADFSDGLWGLTANGSGQGLYIDQPGEHPRTFIGGEFRGIGSGTNLIHVNSCAYSKFPGVWHMRSGADNGQSYGYAIRLWENGIWKRGSAMSFWDLVKISGFTRWAIDYDPTNDPVNNNNIGGRFGRVYANNCGSAVDRTGNDFNIAYSAGNRTGAANSSLQRTNLTLAAGYAVLRVGDIVRVGGDYAMIMEMVGAVISIYPWVMQTAATGTVNSCHGGAMYLHGKDTAGCGADSLNSVTNGVGLYLASQHGSSTGEFIVEGGGLGMMFGVPNGASIGHNISWFHAEANTLDIIGLADSQATLHINTASGWPANDADPFTSVKVLIGNDGTVNNTTTGLPWFTLDINGTRYESGRNSGTYGVATKSRAFFPSISNEKGVNTLKKIQPSGSATNLNLKYSGSVDQFIRNGFDCLIEVASPTGGPPDTAITLTLDAADVTAGITLMGSTSPYVISAASMTGPVRLVCWLDTTGATRNWIVLKQAGFSPTGTITPSSVAMPTGGTVSVNAVQVLTARQTGWTAATGTRGVRGGCGWHGIGGVCPSRGQRGANPHCGA